MIVRLLRRLRRFRFTSSSPKGVRSGFKVFCRALFYAYPLSTLIGFNFRYLEIFFGVIYSCFFLFWHQQTGRAMVCASVDSVHALGVRIPNFDRRLSLYPISKFSELMPYCLLPREG